MTLGEDGCTSNKRRLYQAIIPVFDQYFKILFITNYKYQFVVHKVLKILEQAAQRATTIPGILYSVLSW